MEPRNTHSHTYPTNTIDSVRAAATLPLWKNVVFSAAGGVAGVLSALTLACNHALRRIHMQHPHIFCTDTIFSCKYTLMHTSTSTLAFISRTNTGTPMWEHEIARLLSSFLLLSLSPTHTLSLSLSHTHTHFLSPVFSVCLSLLLPFSLSFSGSLSLLLFLRSLSLALSLFLLSHSLSLFLSCPLSLIHTSFSGAVVVYPLDISKTQLQMDKAGKFRGLFHCFNTIKAEGGMGALYRFSLSLSFTPPLLCLSLSFSRFCSLSLTLALSLLALSFFSHSLSRLNSLCFAPSRLKEARVCHISAFFPARTLSLSLWHTRSLSFFFGNL